MNNINNISQTIQNASANNNENIEILKRLGIEFYTDNNGSIQSRRSKVISVEKLFTDPEIMLHYKGGFFISDPTETYWIYIRILNGKIKELIPVTSIHINSFSIINYNKGNFDFIFLEYSTTTNHTESKTAIITQKNYSPKRITKDLTGTPYISYDGEKLKGALLYSLISKRVTNSNQRKILYVGKNQGWWMTPENKYRFNPPQNLRNEILEHLPYQFNVENILYRIALRRETVRLNYIICLANIVSFKLVYFLECQVRSRRSSIMPESTLIK